jgi:hypothetical protein
MFVEQASSLLILQHESSLAGKASLRRSFLKAPSLDYRPK